VRRADVYEVPMAIALACASDTLILSGSCAGVNRRQGPVRFDLCARDF